MSLPQHALTPSLLACSGEASLIHPHKGRGAIFFWALWKVPSPSLWAHTSPELHKGQRALDVSVRNLLHTSLPCGWPAGFYTFVNGELTTSGGNPLFSRSSSNDSDPKWASLFLKVPTSTSWSSERERALRPLQGLGNFSGRPGPPTLLPTSAQPPKSFF